MDPELIVVVVSVLLAVAVPAVSLVLWVVRQGKKLDQILELLRRMSPQ